MTLLSRMGEHLLREGAGIVAPVQEKNSTIHLSLGVKSPLPRLDYGTPFTMTLLSRMGEHLLREGAGIVAPVQEKKHLLREGAGIVAPVQEKESPIPRLDYGTPFTMTLLSRMGEHLLREGAGIVAPVQEKKGGGDDIRKTLWVLDDQRPQVLSEKTDHSANGEEYVVSCN